MISANVAPVVGARRRINVGTISVRTILYVVTIAGAFLYSMPFVWMLSTSVKPGYEVLKIPPQWIPDVWMWENYTRPWTTLPFALFYRNTTIIAVSDIIATLVASSMVAFAFARMRFRGRDALFMLVLSTMMLPTQVTLIPIYVFFSRLGLVNTLFPLIIPSLFGSPFNIFLLRQFMLSIPLEMDDAARIDGASWIQIYSRILLPLAAPALGVVAIGEFTFRWNDYIGPLIYLNEAQNFTVSLGLTLLNSQYVTQIQAIMAQTVLAVIPVLLVFFFTQRFYVQGIVISGVKG
jgi:ABC-type glycerol-3-phosphate transport system permease component